MECPDCLEKGKIVLHFAYEDGQWRQIEHDECAGHPEGCRRDYCIAPSDKYECGYENER
jgi:hypothetical protein